MENNLHEFVEDDIFSDEEYKLLITIVNRGFEVDVLEAAKSIGSNGAILLQGKGVSKSERKFLGINIDPENTVVMILVKADYALQTMKAIYSVSNFKSKAHGMAFALPVSMVAGMDKTFEKLI